MKKLAIFTGIALFTCVVSVNAGQTLVKELAFQTSKGALRLVFGLTNPVQPQVFYLHHPERMIVDLHNTRFVGKLPTVPISESFVQGIRSGYPDGSSLRVVIDFTHPVEARDFWLTTDQRFGHKLVLDMKREGYTATINEASVITKAAVKPNYRLLPSRTVSLPKFVHRKYQQAFVPAIKTEIWNKARSKSSKSGRNLIVVIDPGHGGKDSGAIGPNGVYEKDVVLAIGRNLANKINAEAGMRAVMTRSTDVFIALRQRVKKARAAHGDLFISIHADAALNSNAQGASVYALSEKGASSAEARMLADRENAADMVGETSEDKDDLLMSVLVNMIFAATMESSSKAANNVLSRLYNIGELHKESVQYAGFAVLKAPDIPSMLVETAYISNAEEEMKLSSYSYQEQIASAIFDGVREYFQTRPPTGTRLAEVVKQRRIAE